MAKPFRYFSETTNGSFKLPENRYAKMKRKMEQLAEDQRSLTARVAAAKKRVISWTPEQFKRATSPLVYIWWGESTEHPLYIGMSRHGVSRSCNRQHHCSDVMEQLAVRVEFIPCASAQEAEDMEKEFIRLLKPQYNKTRYYRR